MFYYFEAQKQLQLKEVAVDCDRCHIDLKCCTYRPFFANFLLGYADELGRLKEGWSEEWDLLIVGASPRLDYRKKLKSGAGWGFGTDESLLCTFFNRKVRTCDVWMARPGVCRAFYCKSSFAEKGSLYWKKFEDYIWHLEWCLLEDFLFTQGFVVDEIQQMKDFLDGSAIKKAHVPSLEAFRFKSEKVACHFYRQAWAHASSLAPQYIEEIIGEFGRNLYSELLAEKAKLK